ncbi:MAG: phage portal protein [Rhodobacter sp.]|nr:phage portal protein [Rhodobacter sp.]
MAFWSRLLRRTRPEPTGRRSFDAAAGSRRGESFGRHFGSHGAETLAAGPTVRARARHAYANNGYVRNGVDAIVAESVGAGIEANSAYPDRDVAAQIDSLFYAADLDAEGRTDFRGMTAAAVLAELVDGEAFFVAEARDGRTVWRQLPAEFIDESDTRELSDGYVAAGIHFNNDGTRRAYTVRPQRPTDLYPAATDPVIVSADSMLHIFRPLGPGQVRGISALAPILLTVNELDQALDATLVGLKISAMFAGFVVDHSNMGGAAQAFPDADGLTDISLEPGVMRVLPGGTDVKFASPEQAKEQIAFAKLTLGQIAAGLGVPQHLVDGDLSQANYSSLRAGLLPFRAKVEQFVYHTLAPQFLDPIFRRFVTDEYLAERLDVEDLDSALKVEWLPPRPMQVDPEKDMGAAETALRLGLTSRRQAVASLGWNVAELDAEIAADRAREAELGLTFYAKESPDAA